VYAHDSITLLPSLKLAVGARVDHWGLTQTRYAIDPSSLATTARTSRTKQSTTAPTWRAGLVYQPTQWGTLYGSVATAFRPAREVPADNHQLSPEHGRQFELGLRTELLKRQALVNVAIYDIAKYDVVVGRGAGVYDQSGKQASRGIEVDANLQPFHGFSAQVGYAYTHARYDDFQSSDGTDYSGKAVVNVPEHLFSLWSTYRSASGFGAGLGGRAVGRSYADPANHVPLHAYAIMDAALYYRFSPIELALNADNVFNTHRYFVSSINDTQLTPGQPRVILASLRVWQ